ncbi:hypothetical protein GTR02_11065 [Kineococcus sp. R8]|uniref:hypothetical protein n=1 Tax=Kineococcus siccus TaxID=2696567 RepID=UPI001412C669|nr:hypothetical protein [Kineococcus siccus]NAZ82359.1 hypothetical protein [Kineococcus siccus]
MGDAAAACSTAPVPAGSEAVDGTAGLADRREAYAQAADLAASAAREDPRWQELADGYATLTETAAQVLEAGDGWVALSDDAMTRMVTDVVAANDAVRRLCAVAEVG